MERVNPPAIAVQNLLVLGKRHRPLLQVPNFVLPAGEICGVYGPSTETNSRFLRCIAGVAAADRGTVRVFGRPLSSTIVDPAFIGFIPRDGGLFGDYSVGENIRLAASHLSSHTNRDRRDQIERVVATIGLDEWLRTPVKLLPDGIRQRASLCCALVCQASLVIADDPWGRADIESREVIENALHDYCSDGNTLLFSSPREEEIVGLATDICVFDESTMVTRGSLDRLAEHLDQGEKIVVRVSKRAATLADRIAAIPGLRSCTQHDETLTLRVEPGAMRLTRLADHVRHLGLELLDMHIERPRLSEIYAQIVGTGNTV